MPSNPFLHQSQDHGGPQMSQLKAGQRLFNRRYELRHQLGAGGMGVVWLARDHTEEIEVALKFLPTVLVLQESEMKRLREEVRAGKELRHAKIVATYGMEIEGTTAAIVMEYVPGKTLWELLEEQERGFYEPEDIAPWIKDISEALDYLHTKAKRIHRDLKPANVIVDATGEARLMDFGISHRIQEGITRQSRSVVPLGVPPLGGPASLPPNGGTRSDSPSSSTLAYASPQQISGKPAHPSDDIYSLGATIYELLTGTPPFYRGGAEAVAIQIKMEPVTPLMERRAELAQEGVNASIGAVVGEPWNSLTQRCLAKEPGERPARAQDIADSLTGRVGSAASKPPKSGARALTLGALILAGSVAAFFYFHQKGASEPDKGKSSPEPAPVKASLTVEQALDRKTSSLFLNLNSDPQFLEKAAPTSDSPKAKSTAPSPAAPTVPMGVAIAGRPGFVYSPHAAKHQLVNVADLKPGSLVVCPYTQKEFRVPPPWISATKEKPFINSLGMRFVPVGIAGRTSASDLCFSIWETRNADYLAFLKAESGGVTPSQSEDDMSKNPDHPARVNHEKATAFCEWLTQTERQRLLIGPRDAYRLPTDAEWSHAIGIGKTEAASASPEDKHLKLPGVYPWGTEFPPPNGAGNYADMSSWTEGSDFSGLIKSYRDGYAGISPAGSFQPNAAGIYDLGGGVWEWTSTPWKSGAYNSHFGDFFVLRGGSHGRNEPSTLLSSFRNYLGARFAHGTVGFRCVLNIGHE